MAARDRIVVARNKLLEGQNGEPEQDYKPLSAYEMDLTYEIKHKKPSVTIKDITMLNPGEFGCLTGLPGSGKTAVIEEFEVAFLADLHGLDIDTNCIKIDSRGGNIVVMDSERPPDDNRRSLARIEAKLNVKDNPQIIENDKIKGLKYFTLAEVPTLEHLERHLDEAYPIAKNGVVIIDGILDFVPSMNSEEDTKKMIHRIRSLSVANDATTLMTLHPNKNTDTMAGHLGSHIYRWGRACLLVRSCEADHNVKELTASFGMGKLSHAHQLPEIYFKWSTELNRHVPADKPESDVKYDINSMNQVFTEWEIKGKDKVPSKEFKERYAEIVGLTVDYVRKNHIKQAVEKGFLVSEGKGINTYYLKAEDVKNNSDDDLPF